MAKINPLFLVFLDDVTEVITKEIQLKTYFKLTKQKKLGIQYSILKIMRTSIKDVSNVDNNQMYGFVYFLELKNADNENYELSAVMKDMRENFDDLIKLENTKDVERIISKK